MFEYIEGDKYIPIRLHQKQGLHFIIKAKTTVMISKKLISCVFLYYDFIL